MINDAHKRKTPDNSLDLGRNLQAAISQLRGRPSSSSNDIALATSIPNRPAAGFWRLTLTVAGDLYVQTHTVDYFVVNVFGYITGIDAVPNIDDIPDIDAIT